MKDYKKIELEVVYVDKNYSVISTSGNGDNEVDGDDLFDNGNGTLLDYGSFSSDAFKL